MTFDIRPALEIVRQAARSQALLDEARRNHVLSALAQKIRTSSACIIEENAKDLAEMSESDPMYDRLLLTQDRLEGIAQDLESVVNLPSPLGKVFDERTLPNGLKIERRTVPLGVVAVIYESRPNVTIDVFSLCFKTGNACVLKGGKEAFYSNKIFVGLIKETLTEHQINPESVYLLPADRQATTDLLQATRLIDVLIPRGSQALIDFVRDNAKVPVIETGAGIVHTYFDESGDLEKGRNIIFNAKTRRVSVCNALDTLVIHEARVNELPQLATPLADKNVEIFADEISYNALIGHYPKALLHKATPGDFGREFLSYAMSIKTVSSLEEAIAHIMTYTSGHSEAIIAENVSVINDFLEQIDAAAVYANASTSFTDGAQFGLGAEIGISTQKLHARGPMALDALTSYKWVIRGSGQVRK